MEKAPDQGIHVIMAQRWDSGSAAQAAAHMEPKEITVLMGAMGLYCRIVRKDSNGDRA